MIDALALLPVDQVSDGMQYLFSSAPEENHDTLIELLTYFDATYVSDSLAGRCIKHDLGPSHTETETEHSRSDY